MMKKYRFLRAPWRPFLVVATTALVSPASIAVTPGEVPGKHSAGQSTSTGASASAQRASDRASERASERMSESQAMQEQRRVELRAALRAHKRKIDETARAASAASAAQAALEERHLNALERAEMRQQLGQQLRPVRIDSERTKP